MKSERLLPALIDRLTDLDPDKSTETADLRSMSKTQFRNSVLRDLSWLMNSTNVESEIEFSGLQMAENSVINFGVPSLAGKRFSDMDWHQLEVGLRKAIIAFEPRILPETINIKAINSSSALDHHNLIALDIRGQLWAEPYPIELLLRSQIDLESGQVILLENGGN